MGKSSLAAKKYLVAFLVITLIGAYLRYWWIINIPNVPESDFEGYYVIAKLLS